MAEYKTKNGVIVEVDYDAEHMAAHADVSHEHIAEAIGMLEINESFFIGSFDLGRVVGTTDAVETNDEDDVRMMYRVGRNIPTRVVFGREPEPTKWITVGVCYSDNRYQLFTAFYGPKAEKEVNDPRITDEERPRAEAYWATHALVYDPAKYAD